MKKLFLTLLAAFTIFTSFAQTVRFGIKVGLNLSNQVLNGYAIYGMAKNQSTPGFNIGGIADFAFADFSIQPGLFFTTKGEEIPSHPNEISQNGSIYYVFPPTTYTLNYIEVPVNIIYNAHVSSLISIQIGAGPYFGYGISASRKTPSAQANDSFDDSPGPGAHYRNPDFGLNFLTGLELKKRYLINAQYSLGYANVSNIHNAYPASDIKNRVFSLSAGYLFR